jgi:bifunctional non-homologous end joining protein LigD
VVPATTDPAEEIQLGLPDPVAGAQAADRPPVAPARPMRPTEGTAPFDDAGYLFEPWWPGIHAFIVVDRGVVTLRADALADPGPAFPELAAVAGLVDAERAVIEATILVLDTRARPSADLLRRRLGCGWRATADPLAGHGRDAATAAGPGDGRQGAAPLPGRAAVVATDLLQLGDRSLLGRPFGERRGELAAILRPSSWCLPGRGFVGEGIAVARALGELGFHRVSAHRLDAAYRAGSAGDAWFRIPIEEPVERRPPPFLAVARRLGL